MYSWWYIYIYNILFSTCSWYFRFMFIAWFCLINRVLILILKFNWKVPLRIWNKRKYLITCNARNRFQVINCIIILFIKLDDLLDIWESVFEKLSYEFHLWGIKVNDFKLSIKNKYFWVLYIVLFKIQMIEIHAIQSQVSFSIFDKLVLVLVESNPNSPSYLWNL